VANACCALRALPADARPPARSAAAPARNAAFKPTMAPRKARGGRGSACFARARTLGDADTSRNGNGTCVCARVFACGAQRKEPSASQPAPEALSQEELPGPATAPAALQGAPAHA
jgi:hypothetical protein